MLDLTKYIIGLKMKNTEEINLQRGALDKQDETCVILCIPESKWKEIKGDDEIRQDAL